MAPGSFISYNAAWSFVDDVEEVANEIGKIIKKEPKKAMEASEKGDLSSQIELWIGGKENNRLVLRLRKATDEELEGIGRYRC